MLGALDDLLEPSAPSTVSDGHEPADAAPAIGLAVAQDFAKVAKKPTASPSHTDSPHVSAFCMAEIFEELAEPAPLVEECDYMELDETPAPIQTTNGQSFMAIPAYKLVRYALLSYVSLLRWRQGRVAPAWQEP